MASKLLGMNVFDLLCDDDDGDDVTVLSERKAVVEVPSSPPRNRNHHIVHFNKEEIAAEEERRRELRRVMAADNEGINKKKHGGFSNGNGHVAKTGAKYGASNGETTDDGWKHVSKKVYPQRYHGRNNYAYRRRYWMNRHGGGGAQWDRNNGNAVSENGDGERGYRNGNGSYRGDRKRDGFSGNGRVEYQKVSEAEAKESDQAVEIANTGGENGVNGDDASQVNVNSSEGDASVAASEAAKREETAEKKRSPEEERRRKEWEERQRKRREEAEADAKLMTYAQYQQVLSEKKREAEKAAKKASDAKKVAERLVKDKELENMKLIGKKMVEVDDHKQKKSEKELKKPGSSDQKGRKGKVVDLSDAYKNVRGRDRRDRGDRAFTQGPNRAATVPRRAGIPTDVELLNQVFPKLGETPPPKPAPETSAAGDKHSATAAAKTGARLSAPAGAKSSAQAAAKSSAPAAAKSSAPTAAKSSAPAAARSSAQAASKSSAPAAVKSGSHAKNGARPFTGSETAKFYRPAAK